MESVIFWNIRSKEPGMRFEICNMKLELSEPGFELNWPATELGNPRKLSSGMEHGVSEL